MSSVRSRVLDAVTRFYAQQGRGATEGELLMLLSMKKQLLSGCLTTLTEMRLVARSKNGHLMPVLPEHQPGNLVQRVLTPEELERVRRGAPSTGFETICGSIPAAVALRPPEPQPTRVRMVEDGEDLVLALRRASPALPPVRRQNRSRQRFSDEALLDLLKQGLTRAACAARFRVSDAAITIRCNTLGLPHVTRGKGDRHARGSAAAPQR